MNQNTIGSYVWDTLDSSTPSWGIGQLQNWTGYPAISPGEIPEDKLFLAVGISRIFSGTAPFDILDINVPVYIVYTSTPAKDVNELIANVYGAFGEQVDTIGARLYIETGLDFFDEQLKRHVLEINIVASVFSG